MFEKKSLRMSNSLQKRNIFVNKSFRESSPNNSPKKSRSRMTVTSNLLDDSYEIKFNRIYAEVAKKYLSSSVLASGIH